jgi:hypothetical protein
MLAQPGGDPFRLLAARWLGAADPEQVGAGWLWLLAAVRLCGLHRVGKPHACPRGPMLAFERSEPLAAPPLPPPPRCAQVTQQQRNHAKHMAYGLLYGKGARALAVDMGISVEAAAQRSAEFKRSLPGVCAWMAKVGGLWPISICCRRWRVRAGWGWTLLVRRLRWRCSLLHPSASSRLPAGPPGRALALASLLPRPCKMRCGSPQSAADPIAGRPAGSAGAGRLPS